MNYIKKRLFNLLKIIAILFFIAVFLGLGFVAMNNTVKNMTGDSMQVFNHSDGIVVDIYGKGYLIDFTPLQQAKVWLEEHWVFIPRWIRFIQYIAELL